MARRGHITLIPLLRASPNDLFFSLLLLFLFFVFRFGLGPVFLPQPLTQLYFTYTARLPYVRLLFTRLLRLSAATVWSSQSTYILLNLWHPESEVP